MSLIKFNPDYKTYSPFRLTDVLDNFFNEAVTRVKYNEFVPAVNIEEDEKQFTIHAALPGIKKEDIRLELEEGKLQISGEEKLVEENQKKNYHSIEINQGKFLRTFYLPDSVNTQSIDAEYKDGILTVVLPKDNKKAEKTSITIK